MSEHQQCCGHRHLPYSMVGADICHTRRRRWNLPHASEHQQCYGRRQTALYPTAWATRLDSTHTPLILPLVQPSPSSIKGDALSPKRGQTIRPPGSIHKRFEQPTIRTTPTEHTLKYLAHVGAPVSLGPSVQSPTGPLAPHLIPSRL